MAKPEVLKALNNLQEVIDSMKKCLHCGNCGEILIDPYVLPCGHTVCINHTYENEETRPLVCKSCGRIYEQNYRTISNKFVMDLADMVHKPSFNSFLCFLKDSAMKTYDKIDSKIGLEKLILKCEILKADPFFLVYNEINEIMNRLQLKKENDGLNESICEEDKVETENLIEELTTYKNECRDHLNTPEFSQKLDKLMVDEIETELKACLTFLEALESNEDKVKINEANKRYIEIIDIKMENFIQNELFLNKLNFYKYKINQIKF